MQEHAWITLTVGLTAAVSVNNFKLISQHGIGNYRVKVCESLAAFEDGAKAVIEMAMPTVLALKKRIRMP